jgi:hypothetical protein
MKIYFRKKDFFFSFLLILKTFLYGKKAYLKKYRMTSVDYFMQPIEYFHILLKVTACYLLIIHITELLIPICNRNIGQTIIERENLCR